jgi:hypothetical protein
MYRDYHTREFIRKMYKALTGHDISSYIEYENLIRVIDHECYLAPKAFKYSKRMYNTGIIKWINFSINEYDYRICYSLSKPSIFIGHGDTANIIEEVNLDNITLS